LALLLAGQCETDGSLDSVWLSPPVFWKCPSFVVLISLFLHLSVKLFRPVTHENSRCPVLPLLLLSRASRGPVSCGFQLFAFFFLSCRFLFLPCFPSRLITQDRTVLLSSSACPATLLARSSEPGYGPLKHIFCLRALSLEGSRSPFPMPGLSQRTPDALLQTSYCLPPCGGRSPLIFLVRVPALGLLLDLPESAPLPFLVSFVPGRQNR